MLLYLMVPFLFLSAFWLSFETSCPDRRMKLLLVSERADDSFKEEMREINRSANISNQI